MNLLIDELTAQRRRIWYSFCSGLGLNEDDQRAIASGIIPNGYPGATNARGELSRRPLFANGHFFNQAYLHLIRLKRGREASHHRVDGSRTIGVTPRQIEYARILARKMGWDKGGADDLAYRLGRFAARQTGDSKGIRLLEGLTAGEMRLVIDGLKVMVRRHG